MTGNPPSPGAEERVAITGAAGFLGRHLLRVLLEQLPGARFVCLLRARKGKSPEQRLQSLVGEMYPPAQCEAALRRIEVLPADIEARHCGLGNDEWARAAAGITRVIHAAASTRFDLPLQEARRINVGGTRHVIDFAEEALRRGSLKSFTYVSTAFVAGERTGLVLEDAAQAGQRFRNAYERTKFEAERLVRSRVPPLPVVILRPSIVVGDSRTGATTSFKTIYWPLKVHVRARRWRIVPGSREAVLDLVPVDFVADAIAHLALDERAIGRTVHLCAGRAACARLGEAADFATRFFGVPRVRFVHPAFATLLGALSFAAVWGARRRVITQAWFYLPYFNMHTVFDTARAEELLEAAGIRPPKVMDYLEKLFRFSRETNWGESQPRAAANACSNDSVCSPSRT